MNSLDSLFLALREELDRLPSERGAAAFEGVLHDVSASKNPQIIGQLCAFFDDDHRCQEALWSILHLVEDFDCAVYVKELLQVSPSLSGRCPKWAGRLFTRILNSESYRDELALQVRTSNNAAKTAVSTIFQRIREDYPSEFDAKMTSVLASLR